MWAHRREVTGGRSRGSRKQDALVHLLVEGGHQGPDHLVKFPLLAVKLGGLGQEWHQGPGRSRKDWKSRSRRGREIGAGEVWKAGAGEVWKSGK